MTADLLRNTDQTSEYLGARGLGYSSASLKRLRSSGGGPAYIKLPGLRGKVVYERSAIDSWLRSLVTSHTAEASARDGAQA